MGTGPASIISLTQFAKEKITNNADITELPAEYRQLEEQVDRVKLMTELFLKISRNYTIHAYDYEPPVTEKLNDFASVVSASASSFAERLSGTQQATSKATQQEIPPSLSHAYAKASFQSTQLISPEVPLGAALQKFAGAQEKIGNARLQQDNDAILKFHNPFLKAIDGRIAEAMKSRRDVQACRLSYDSCRSRLKAAAPNRAESIRTEMIEAEDEFVAAVDSSMNKMKLVVDNGEALRCLSDLVAIQLQYHKAAVEALSQLGPELDELVVTNEALYSPP